MNDKIVPFGKYKGQPVDLMLQDTNYCDWLKDQAGIRDRYNDIYVTIINYQKSEDSLEHNLMQMKFLKEDYVINLLSKEYEWVKDFIVKQTRFEIAGWDVLVKITDEHGDKLCQSQALNTKISKLEKEIWNLKKEQKETRDKINFDSSYETYREYQKHVEELETSFENKIEILKNQSKELEAQEKNINFINIYFFIEIKPVVSDDFPNVMRQIESVSHKGINFNGDGSYINTPASQRRILLVGAYTGQGATQDEFIAFMKTKDIDVIFA
jgi:hypothetical protein